MSSKSKVTMVQVEEIVRVFRELRLAMRDLISDSLKESDFTLAQISVVSVLVMNGDLKVSEIAKYIGMADSTVSGIIDRLEKKDVVQRKRTVSDRRIVMIHLNPSYGQIYENFRQERYLVIKDHLGELSESEIQTVIKGLSLFASCFPQEQLSI
jgi:MarR family transcriptional regulator, organic hydroperoxide resistance regulator